MTLSHVRAALLLLSLSMLSPALAADAPPNFRQASDSHWTAGQPTAEQLPGLKAAGIVHLIALRPASESPLLGDEAAASGLSYTDLAIAGPQSLTPGNVAAFDQLLRDAGDRPTLIYCASGNRVGAMIALRAAWLEGAAIEEAIAEGKRYGLTSLEAVVRERLAAAH